MIHVRGDNKKGRDKMKHKDYTKFSGNTENNIQNNPVIPTEPVTPVLPEDQNDPEVITDPVTPVLPEDQNEPEVITEPENNEDNSGTNLLAVVVNCAKLNVRKEASKDSEVVCIITKGDEVAVDLDASTEDFYKINTSNGIEGYCVKDFIEIK